MKCQHKNEFFVSEFTCKAFPGGIPEEILTQQVEHDRLYGNQKNKIVFRIIKGELL